jgi:hypothetical protein
MMMRADWSFKRNQLRIGEALLDDQKYYGQYLKDHGRRDRHHLLCNHDRGLQCRDYGVLHLHHGPASGDHGFCNAEDLLDHRTMFYATKTMVSGFDTTVFVSDPKVPVSKTMVNASKTMVGDHDQIIDKTRFPAIPFF